MRAPKNCFRVLLCAFLIAALAAAQQAKTSLTIVVTDASGAPIPHAQVRLVPALDPAPAMMATDDKGKLRLDLLPCSYGLIVSDPGFKTSDSQINVQPATNGQTITVTLTVGTFSGLSFVGDPSTLVISDTFHHEELKFSAAQLKALPHVSVTVHNPHTNADESYSGVRLSDLLAKLGAPLDQQLRGTALKSYVVATGSDGYQAVFSLAEVDPAFHPGEILAADTMNGAPLDAKTGPFRLVVSEDKRPARSVRNMVSIELRSVQ
jgi:hypothetical protein